MKLAQGPGRNKLFSGRKVAEDAIDRTKRDKDRSWTDLGQDKCDVSPQYPEHHDDAPANGADRVENK